LFSTAYELPWTSVFTGVTAFYEIIIIIDPAHFSLATNPKFGKYERVLSLKNGDLFYLLEG